MKKKNGLLKSVSVCLVVALLMVGAGLYLLNGENQGSQTGGKVEAAWDGQSFETKDEVNNEEKVVEEGNQEEAVEEDCKEEAVEVEEEVNISDNSVSSESTESTESNSADNTSGNEKPAEEDETAAVQTTSAPVENSTEQEASKETEKESKPVESATEQPAAVPDTTEEEKKEEPKQEVQSVSTSAPVTYRWGSASNYTFRIEVSVTNNGSEASRNVNVAVPLLENSSPYQETSLKSVNFDIVSSSGRVSTFDLGELAPGETKTIRADFAVRINSVAINSSNETVEKARQAYEKYAGSGNCRALALAFINECREMGINAREVIGFARPQRGNMTSGSLAGCRHSWAEFEVPGLGWVPVDLTFQHFGELPHTSHVVESYSDQSIKVNFSGGSLSANWSNLIL